MRLFFFFFALPVTPKQKTKNIKIDSSFFVFVFPFQAFRTKRSVRPVGVVTSSHHLSEKQQKSLHLHTVNNRQLKICFLFYYYFPKRSGWLTCLVCVCDALHRVVYDFSVYCTERFSSCLGPWRSERRRSPSRWNRRETVTTSTYIIVLLPDGHITIVQHDILYRPKWITTTFCPLFGCSRDPDKKKKTF